MTPPSPHDPDHDVETALRLQALRRLRPLLGEVYADRWDEYGGTDAGRAFGAEGVHSPLLCCPHGGESERKKKSMKWQDIREGQAYLMDSGAVRRVDVITPGPYTPPYSYGVKWHLVKGPRGSRKFGGGTLNSFAAHAREASPAPQSEGVGVSTTGMEG